MLFGFAILSIFACSDDDDSPDNNTAQNPGNGGGNNNDTTFISASGTTTLDIGTLFNDTCFGERITNLFNSDDSLRIWVLEIKYDTIANSLCGIRTPGEYDVLPLSWPPPFPDPGQNEIRLALLKAPRTGGIVTEFYLPIGDNTVTVEQVDSSVSVLGSNIQLASSNSPDTVFLSFKVFE